MSKVDAETISKVLESLAINVKAVSMVKEINDMEILIQTLIGERTKAENLKKQISTAQETTRNSANAASQIVDEIKKKIEEINKLVEKATMAKDEAAQSAVIAQKTYNFDDKILQTNNLIIQATQFKKGLMEDLNEVKLLREELKKEGIDIDLSKKRPNPISIGG
jgi:hypothetical protein